MIIFFDKIAYRVFLFSKFIHKNIFGKGNYNDDAKIQTLFIISLSQSIYSFFIILNLVLVVFFDTNMPKYFSLSGLILFCIFNYFRYYKGNILEEDKKVEYLFFKSNLMTNLISIFYFIIGVFLFLKVGDFIREINLLIE